MCRLLGWVSREPRTLRDVLGEEGLATFVALARWHAHGWGVATAGNEPGGAPQVLRSARGAADDPTFLAVATGVATTAAVVHLRWATQGLPVEERNSHPFQHDQTAFAHNGAIHPVREVGAALDPAWRARATGVTDSELYHLGVLQELAVGAPNVATAFARIIARLAHLESTSFNAMLLDPSTLYSVSCHDPAEAPGDQGGATSLVAATQVEADAPYFDLRYRAKQDAVVVASSGFAQPAGDGWRGIPNGSILAVDRTSLAADVVPLPHVG